MTLPLCSYLICRICPFLFSKLAFSVPVPLVCFGILLGAMFRNFVGCHRSDDDGAMMVRALMVIWDDKLSWKLDDSFFYIFSLINFSGFLLLAFPPFSVQIVEMQGFAGFHGQHKVLILDPSIDLNFISGFSLYSFIVYFYFFNSLFFTASWNGSSSWNQRA